MILKELKLHNIRSYLDATVEFPEGSMVLSGDIGAGKSTLLLAVEFALFGSSRTDLSGEMLLRKGENTGFVELTFVLEEQDITIKRSLKREKQAVKQLSGFIIRNGVKKELTPVELRAEVLLLLGYPDDLILKNKNPIFRYTVYTPQEEMKLILLEDSEQRLDVLRKIFAIDKYKVMRENLQIYLRMLRGRVALLESKIEPLVSLQEEITVLQGEIELRKRKSEELLVKNEEMELTVKKSSLVIEELEAAQRKRIEREQRKIVLEKGKGDKEREVHGLEAKKRNLEIERESFILGEHTDLRAIDDALINIERRRREFLEKKFHLDSAIRQAQEKLTAVQKETAHLERELTLLPLKDKQLQDLELAISDNKNIEEFLIIIENEIKGIQEKITREATLLSSSEQIVERISQLNDCPTCLQHVSYEYKENIHTLEQAKIKRARLQLDEFQLRQHEAQSKAENWRSELEVRRTQEKELTRATYEIRILIEKKKEFDLKAELVKDLIITNNRLMSEYVGLDFDESLRRLESETAGLVTSKNILLRRGYIQEQIKLLEEQRGSAFESLSGICLSLDEISKDLAVIPDQREVIASKKQEFFGLMERAKQIAVDLMQVNTQKQGFVAQLATLEAKKEVLDVEKAKLVRIKEYVFWLEEHFTSLTYTLEKHVMAHLHSLFSGLFTEWFCLLLDEENVYARIDETFSPVIEQNGYEVTFSSLSGGEKTSCALAYRLALNRVINQVVSTIKTQDLLILDEPTDGFSLEQLDRVRNVLDRLDLKQSIIVSHESKIESFVDNVIRVRKEGHVSVVEG